MKGQRAGFQFQRIEDGRAAVGRQQGMEAEIERRRELQRSVPQPTLEQWMEATPQATLDLLASFQHTVIQELLLRGGGGRGDRGALPDRFGRRGVQRRTARGGEGGAVSMPGATSPPRDSRPTTPR